MLCDELISTIFHDMFAMIIIPVFDLSYFVPVDVDMSFDWVDERLYRTHSQRMQHWKYYQPNMNMYGLDSNLYVWQKMYGAFSSPGFRRGRRKLHKSRSSSAHGAVCQFQ